MTLPFVYIDAVSMAPAPFAEGSAIWSVVTGRKSNQAQRNERLIRRLDRQLRDHLRLDPDPPRLVKKAPRDAQAAAGSGDVPQVTANKRQGDAFENKVVADAEKTDVNVAQEVTVKTRSGTKTRIDVCSECPKTGSPKLTEAKSSAEARLTGNQKKAFPEIEKSGATVVGKGKPGWPSGRVIPPTKVKVKRP